MTDISQQFNGRNPKVAIILGSSLGSFTDSVVDPLRISYRTLPGFPVPQVSGHAGELVMGHVGGTEVAVLAGRGHAYESGNAAVMRPVIETLKNSGIETLVLTNAAGSLTTSMRPGSIMMITDHINLSGMNPLIGTHGDENFVSLTDAYDPELQNQLRSAAKAENIALNEGVYIWCSGPSFETPAEIRMFALLGGQAIGMSTVPETIMARRYGLRVAALSVITNLAAGLEGASPSHDETKREGAKAAGDMAKLLTQFFKNLK